MLKRTAQKSHYFSLSVAIFMLLESNMSAQCQTSPLRRHIPNDAGNPSSIGKVSAGDASERLKSAEKLCSQAKYDPANIMGPLRYILNVAVRRKLIADNPAANVTPLREEQAKIDPLTLDELNQVLAVLKPYQRVLFTCLAWTGARPEELFALRWQDVSLERNEIYITKGRVRGTEGTTKTRSSNRTLPIFSVVREILLEQKKNPTQHVDGYVFLNKQNQPYDKHGDREWRTAL